MTGKRALAWAGVALSLAAMVLWLVGLRDSREAPQGDSSKGFTQENSPIAVEPQSEAAEIDIPVPDARLNRLPDGRVEFLPALEISRNIHREQHPEETMAHIESVLGLYRFAFGGNPVGVENFEITEQLLGKNPQNAVFIAPDSEALRGNELIDRWGTPYMFHALSGTEMEIRSAGPDRKLWTEDDVKSALGEN